jgi:hypothetical protein
MLGLHTAGTYTAFVFKVSFECCRGMFRPDEVKEQNGPVQLVALRYMKLVNFWLIPERY